MPFANNQDVRIHYEVEGKGPPMVLQHGFAENLASWYGLGYVDALKQDYRLVLIDARGHGQSDRPHEPEAYRKALRAGDVVAVLDDLGIDKTHFLGYSMGGSIGYSVARFAPEHLVSLIVGGASPYEGDPSKPNPAFEEWISWLRRGPEAFKAFVDPKHKQVIESDLTDVDALIAFLSLRERAGTADVIATMAIPCLVFAGENDQMFYSSAKRAAEGMRNGTFVSIPGADHLECLARADLVLPHVRRFLSGLEGG